MDNMTETPPPSPPPPLPEMILSLEQAVLMTKQLPATTDPTHLLQIYSSLHQAHHHLSSFLSNTQFPLPPPPPPSAAENSLSSATNENGNEPMQIGDNDEVEAEENSKITIEKVEESLRDCFIKNKRPKRQLSPSSVAVAEERRLYEDGFVGGAKGYDPHGTKLRAFDLVYQFHA